MLQPLFLLNRDLSRKYERLDTDYSTISALGVPKPKDVAQRHVGVEVEVEDIVPINTPGWQQVADGSLRGQMSLEYKTRFPCNCVSALNRVQYLFATIRKQRKEFPDAFQFNERTSIHVHVDVRDLTMPQITSVLKMYLLFERSFFDLIGRARRHNIFCIPAINTLQMNNQGEGHYHNWEKYCAINMAAIYSFGTVEFRGMAGTDNAELIQRWIIMLAALVNYSRDNSPEEINKTINTLKVESQYVVLAREIWGEALADTLTMFPEDTDIAATATKFL